MGNKITKRLWISEVWRIPKYIRQNGEIIEFTDYTISNYYRIKNKYNEIMKPYTDKKGYLRIDLFKNKKRYSLKIHRLMASTFISCINNIFDTVNHKDGVKGNNYPYNLEWASFSHNTQHAYDNNLFKGVIGDAHGKTWVGENNIRKICELLQETNMKYSEIAVYFIDICQANNRTIKQLINIIKDIKKRKSYSYISINYDFSKRNKKLNC